MFIPVCYVIKDNGQLLGWFFDLPEIKAEAYDLVTLIDELHKLRDRYDYCGFEIMLEELCIDLGIEINIDE